MARYEVVCCDFCGDSEYVLDAPISIDGLEYDICKGCRDKLAEKLKGKGRLNSWAPAIPRKRKKSKLRAINNRLED